MQPVQNDPLGEEPREKYWRPGYRLRNVFAAGHRLQLTTAVAITAAKLLPLLAVQAQVNNESVFRTRRRKIQTHLAIAYAELRAERPSRLALSYTFHTLAELVKEETHGISPNELKQAAKEVALATLRHAPALISVAHQARLLT